jgi:alkylated DNA repair dioxygenase AlkB
MLRKLREKMARNDLPQGFFYRPEFISVQEEEELLTHFQELDFKAFDFHGYVAKRRVIEYGFEYDFGSRRTNITHSIPEFLNPYKLRAAAWAAFPTDELVEAIVTEYPPGAPIGWHRDAPQFEAIVGISLKSCCRLRFKPYKTNGATVSVMVEPRSIYLISKAARTQYQHSIPAARSLRYSITFRSLRTRPSGPRNEQRISA